MNMIFCLTGILKEYKKISIQNKHESEELAAKQNMEVIIVVYLFILDILLYYMI